MNNMINAIVNNGDILYSNNETYNKIVSKLIDKMSKLQEKCISDPDKLAAEIVKVFKQTIIKLINTDELGEAVDAYLCDCGFTKVSLVGEKLTDENTDYIENLFNTNDSGVIQSMDHPAYYFEYTDSYGDIAKAIIGSIVFM